MKASWSRSFAICFGAAALGCCNGMVHAGLGAAEEPIVFASHLAQNGDKPARAKDNKTQCAVCHATTPTNAAGSKSCLRDLVVDDNGRVGFDLFVEASGGQPVEALGLELAPVDDALRAQTSIPAEQGLIVRKIEAASPLKEKVQQFDVLLKVDDVIVRTVEDCTKRLLASDEKPIVLEIVRQGKPARVRLAERTLSGRHRFIEAVAAAQEEEAKNQYWIGTSVSQVDDTLRSHLAVLQRDDLKDVGLVVTEVHVGSPAQSAKLQKNDVLCKLNDRSLKSSKDLVACVQECGDQRVALLLVRGGDLVKAAIQPLKRPRPPTVVEGKPLDFGNAMALRYLLAQPGVSTTVEGTRLSPLTSLALQQQNAGQWLGATGKSIQPLEDQLKKLSGQLEAMQSQVQKLGATLDRIDKESQVRQHEQLNKALDELRGLLKQK